MTTAARPERSDKTAPAVGIPLDRRVGPLRVLLAGRSLKGKSRLREAAISMPVWDGVWLRTEERDSVPFAPGKPGPWLFVRPDVEDAHADTFSRWVHLWTDEHFTVSAA